MYNLHYQDLALAACLSLISIAPLLIWRSRYNIPGIMALGFSMAAFVIPVIFVGSQHAHGEAAHALFLKLIYIGAPPFLIGMWLAFKASSGERLAGIITVNVERKEAKVISFAIFIIIGMALTYALMGFIPALASDPRAAKYLRGAYQLNTGTNTLYRLFTSMAVICLPLMLALALDRRRILYFAIALSIFSIFILNMTRAPAGFPILLVLGLMAAKIRASGFYIILMILAYIFGSLLNYILGYVDSGQSVTIFQLVEAGVPDVRDQVWFLEKYLASSPDFTIGKTFLGGLVPGNYKWNPAVWSVTLGDASVAVENLNTGGLRLAPPLQIYVAFGTPFVPVLMFFSGAILGYFLKAAKIAVCRSQSYFEMTLALVYFTYIGKFISGFYNFRYTGVISILVVIFVIYRFKFSDKGKAPVPEAAE